MVLITAPAEAFRDETPSAVESAPVSMTLAMSATLETDDSLAAVTPAAVDAGAPADPDGQAAQGGAVGAAPKGASWAVIGGATVIAIAGVLGVGWSIGTPTGTTRQEATPVPGASQLATDAAPPASTLAPSAVAPPSVTEPAPRDPQPNTASIPASTESDDEVANGALTSDSEATRDAPDDATNDVDTDDVAPPLPPEPATKGLNPPLGADRDSDEPSAPAESNGPVIRDPLDIDPATVGLILRRGPSTSPTVPASTTTSGPTETEAERDPAERVAMDLDERLAAVGKGVGVRVERGPTGDPASSLPKIPAASALETPLPAAQLTDAPLWGAVELLGEVAGVPISIDPAALAAAGVAANEQVSLEFARGTVGEALRELLARVRLDWEGDGPYVMVVRREKAGPATRTVEHRLGDLANGDEADLVTLLEAIGPPGIAPPGEGIVDGRWSLAAPNRTHYELLVVCERLRVARGLPPATRYARGLLATKPALAELGPLLERRTTISFLTPTPLAEVIEHVRRATGLTILVDWRSLADVSLGPASTVLASANHRPWEETLDGLLEPLGLGWGALDSGTLWIASRSRLAAQEFVEFYPLATAAEAETLAQSLGSMNPPTRAIADGASRSVIVRGDATAQRAAHAAWHAALGEQR